jgi:hypothetical protein
MRDCSMGLCMESIEGFINELLDLLLLACC